MCVDICGEFFRHDVKVSVFLPFLSKPAHKFPVSVAFILHVLLLCCCVAELVKKVLRCPPSNGKMSSSDQTDLTVASALPHF